MKKTFYSAPACDTAAMEATEMLAASYGDNGKPGYFDLGDDIIFPKPF